MANETTTEVMELSLEQAIETKLVQANVTQRILGELKDKYGEMKLKALDDKESYLEIKAAAKECAKVRTLTVKLCKEGRDEAVKTQKAWVAKEKEIVAQVAEVEDALDAEAAKFDAEVLRVQNEEKQRKEESYIIRQAQLTKMGASYEGGNFVLGDISFEANLIKESSETIWETSVLPSFTEAYNEIEKVRIAEEAAKQEAADELKRQQAELARQQEEFRQQQAEAEKQRQEQIRLGNEKFDAERKEQQRIQNELQKERFDKVYPVSKYGEIIDINMLYSLTEQEFNKILSEKTLAFDAAMAEKERIAEEKRQQEIEAAKQLAIKQEQERVEQEEVKRKAEMEAASDKIKWNEFLQKVQGITTFDMRSGQYRKKMQVAKEKIEEILSL